MLQRQGSLCRRELVPHAGEVALWQTATVQSLADIEHVIGVITAAARDTAGLPADDLSRLRLALDEAFANAHQHGHQGAWGKPITVRYQANGDGVAAEIEDQGGGFDPAQVPDPLAPENLERPSGRGLFLMRVSMSQVCHNEWGNCICLCRLCPGDKGPRP